MRRVVEPELLDDLPPDDPGAIRSRRDIHRLNGIMGNARFISRVLKEAVPPGGSMRLLDIGTGDGRLLLDVARRCRGTWRQVDAVLLDKVSILDAATRQQVELCGWRVRTVASDVFGWLEQAGAPGREAQFDVVLANLFLHHFAKDRLATLLSILAANTRVFVSVDPRRSRLAMMASRMLWLIGCGPVTRYDAQVSVRAGFLGAELSGLWPGERGWDREERAAGLFGHLFVARHGAAAPD